MDDGADSTRRQIFATPIGHNGDLIGSGVMPLAMGASTAGKFGATEITQASSELAVSHAAVTSVSIV